MLSVIVSFLGVLSTVVQCVCTTVWLSSFDIYYCHYLFCFTCFSSLFFFTDVL